VQDHLEAALRQSAEGVALMTQTRAKVSYDRYYPATVNDASAAQGVIAALDGVCPTQVLDAPALTSEDFAFMLQVRPGAYVWLGQGTAAEKAAIPLHHPGYDFNDDVLRLGVAVHVALALHALKPVSVES
jgi:hippurate hydrolase